MTDNRCEPLQSSHVSVALRLVTAPRAAQGPVQHGYGCKSCCPSHINVYLTLSVSGSRCRAETFVTSPSPSSKPACFLNVLERDASTREVAIALFFYPRLASWTRFLIARALAVTFAVGRAQNSKHRPFTSTCSCHRLCIRPTHLYLQM